MQSNLLRFRASMLASPVVDTEPLVARLQRGDMDALAEAYDAHHVALRAFARKLVGDDAAAEDLVQEVFVSLPSAIRRFRGESSLGTFLVSVAINHARHFVRAAARRRRALERLSYETRRGPRDPERNAVQLQLAGALFAALDALPLDQRVAFVLCEIEERSSVEVAAIVGANEATVRGRLFHARKKLRVLLESEGVR